MFDLNITPESLIIIAAALAAIVFDWFPGLQQWYEPLSKLKKRQVMGVVLLLIVGVVYAGTCYGVFVTGYACDQVGLAELIKICFYAISVNQGVHKLLKR